MRDCGTLPPDTNQTPHSQQITSRRRRSSGTAWARPKLGPLRASLRLLHVAHFAAAISTTLFPSVRYPG